MGKERCRGREENEKEELKKICCRGRDRKIKEKDKMNEEEKDKRK